MWTVVAAVSFTNSSLFADTVIADYSTHWASGTTAILSQIRSDDLINTGSSTLESTTSTDFAPFGADGIGTSNISGLNDGTGGSGLTTLSNANTFDLDGVWTSTFTLNTTTNTAGYDINAIRTFSAWNDYRVNQKYEVFYSTVKNPTTFVSLGIFTDTVHENGSYMISLTGSTGGAIASGVKAIQFSFTDPGQGTTVYQELDVLGAASAVPEPASIAMLVSAAIGLLAYAWRKRR
jgi:hypothetical protein